MKIKYKRFRRVFLKKYSYIAYYVPGTIPHIVYLILINNPIKEALLLVPFIDEESETL